MPSVFTMILEKHGIV